MCKHFDKDSKEELEEYLAEQEEPDYDTDYYSGYDVDSLDLQMWNNRCRCYLLTTTPAHVYKPSKIYFCLIFN